MPSWIAVVSLVVAILALVVSFLTLWIAHLKRGTVKLARPSQFYFGADGRKGALDGPPKVFLRALLYTSGRRGLVVEYLWAQVTQRERQQTFNVWVHGDNELRRGAGLHISDAGVTTGHHFLLSENEGFAFQSADIELEIFARISSKSDPIRLWHQTVPIGSEQAEALNEGGSGLYFDLSPRRESYIARLHAPMRSWLEDIKAS